MRNDTQRQVANAPMDRVMFVQGCGDSFQLLHVIWHDHTRHGPLSLGDANRAVDQLPLQ